MGFGIGRSWFCCMVHSIKQRVELVKEYGEWQHAKGGFDYVVPQMVCGISIVWLWRPAYGIWHIIKLVMVYSAWNLVWRCWLWCMVCGIWHRLSWLWCTVYGIRHRMELDMVYEYGIWHKAELVLVYSIWYLAYSGVGEGVLFIRTGKGQSSLWWTEYGSWHRVELVNGVWCTASGIGQSWLWWTVNGY